MGHWCNTTLSGYPHLMYTERVGVVFGPSVNVMALSKQIRHIAISLALAGLLIFSSTLGSVWHTHSDGSERACPVCHYSHQAADKPLDGHRLPVLAPVGRNTDAVLPAFEPAPDIHRVPARAPPSA
jgi:hypothetical protein